MTRTRLSPEMPTAKLQEMATAKLQETATASCTPKPQQEEAHAPARGFLLHHQQQHNQRERHREGDRAEEEVRERHHSFLSADNNGASSRARAWRAACRASPWVSRPAAGWPPGTPCRRRAWPPSAATRACCPSIHRRRRRCHRRRLLQEGCPAR